MSGMTDLIEKLQATARILRNVHGFPNMAADVDEAAAELKRLHELIDETSKHWLALQIDHPIKWEGAIDAAMKAACDKITRLRATVEKLQPLVAASYLEGVADGRRVPAMSVQHVVDKCWANSTSQAALAAHPTDTETSDG